MAPFYHRAMPLADGFGRLAYRYDAIIVGSGYGGAIAAARLAQAGLSVCVLERGREWLAGEFPDDEAGLFAAVRTPLNPLGLIDPNVQRENDIDVVVGCGLGGTSLINAGISLRPEAEVFEQAEWPAAIREEARAGVLAKWYARAESMLGAKRNPALLEMTKIKTHASLVGERGVPHDTLPLNVSESCTRCGDCVAGCNVGAKNTLVTNYLPLAKKHGARIFTAVEVRRITKTDGDWTVEFSAVRGPLQSAKSGTVRARIVVLGAGSLGSTEILFRSQSRALRFSKTLGDRFSANADIMGMSYAGKVRTDVLAHGREERDWHVGPSLGSYGDFRGKGPLLERFLLIEGAVPTALRTIAGRALGAGALLRLAELDGEQRGRIHRDMMDGPDRKGALNHSLLFLACGHDSSSGRIVLDDLDGRPTIAWPGVDDEVAFRRITEEMQAVTRAHGGVFVPNPRSTIFGGSRQMTVHPLGGCPMGDDVDRGTVDDRGRVFDAEGEAHRGLYVTDGAIIPRSLGVTPLLTISALAERACESILADQSSASASIQND
jgi:cholesterol oxidase